MINVFNCAVQIMLLQVLIAHLTVPCYLFPSFSLCLFPFTISEGSNVTPGHHHDDFRFKTYAPIAFRYFREMFGIRPDDYLVMFSTYFTLLLSLMQNPDLYFTD